MKRLLWLVAGVLSAFTHAAQADTLDGEAVHALVGGKRIFLQTPYGVELPLRYRADGRVEGDVSGIAIASMFAPRETGRWWIDGDRLCQQWPNWYDGKSLCFTVTLLEEDKIAWVREDGLRGIARIED